MSESTKAAYAILARAYDDAGFSQYAAAITEPLLTMLQQTDWLGRSILDLGCGTGMSTAFFSQTGMNTIGLDISPQMLAVARLRVEGTGYLVEFVEGDIRTANYPSGMDLVYCIGNTMNELGSLREVEQVFQKTWAALEPGKRFVFDLLTLRGLAEYIGNGEQILDVSDRLFLTVQNHFNYEGMLLRQVLNCFWQEAAAWQRGGGILTMRSYPTATVSALLEKVGFRVLGMYTTRLEPFNPQRDLEGRVIYVAEKPA